MKLNLNNLNCFMPRGEAQQPICDDPPKPPQQQKHQSAPDSLPEHYKSVAFKGDQPRETGWVSLGLPACTQESQSMNQLNTFVAASPRIRGSCSSRSRLPDKIRHLGDILKSLETSKLSENAAALTKLVSTRTRLESSGYRRNWLDTDFPSLRDNVVETTSRTGSMKSTPRDFKITTTPRDFKISTIPRTSGTPTGSEYNLRVQLNRLEEMLKSQEGSRPATGTKQVTETAKEADNLQMDVLKDVLARVSRIEKLSAICPKEEEYKEGLRMRRRQAPPPSRKRLEKNFRSFMSSIQEQLERTDAAVRKVEKELQRLASRKNSKKISKVSSKTTSSRNIKCESGLDCTEVAAEQVLRFQSDIERMRASTEDARKQCEENRMDVKLCWSALNQLCIDNESFRQELDRIKPLLAPDKLELLNKNQDYEQQASQCGRWSCSGTLQ